MQYLASVMITMLQYSICRVYESDQIILPVQDNIFLCI